MKKSPVFLDLTKISLPITALVSICHRVSGVGLFVLSPFWIIAVYQMWTRSQVVDALTIKVTLWLSLIAYLFHFLAGVRHMIDDLCVSHTLQSSRCGACTVWVLWAILAVAVTVRMWV